MEAKLNSLYAKLDLLFEHNRELYTQSIGTFNEIVKIMAEDSNERTRRVTTADFNDEIEVILESAQERTDALLAKYKAILPEGF